MWRQARARLSVDPATRGLRLAVSCADGQLTLAGTVDADELRDKALEIGRGIPEVSGVLDEIIVVRIPRRYGGV